MKIASLLPASAAPAAAQVCSATLSGAVADATSAAVSGVSVEASQTESGFASQTVTDARGVYSFEGPRPGDGQDDWRVAPRQTVKFGLRWESAAPFTEARSNLINLNYSAAPNPPQFEPVGSVVDPQPHNFAPWAGMQLGNLPRFGGLTVFRAAYGIYYSPEIAVENNDLALNGQLNELNETQGDPPQSEFGTIFWKNRGCR